MYRQREHDAAHRLEEKEGNPTTPSSTPPVPPSIRRFFCMLSPKKKPILIQKHESSPMEEASSSSSSSGNKMSELERVFHYFDENGDGKISPTELRNCMMRTVGTELSAEDAEAVVEHTDSDGDGLLGLDDFVKLVEVEEEEEKKGRSLKDAFAAYVTDGQDYITAKSLKHALRRLGESKSTHECKVMIRCFDLNGDGVLSFEEFRLMML